MALLLLLSFFDVLLAAPSSILKPEKPFRTGTDYCRIFHSGLTGPEAGVTSLDAHAVKGAFASDHRFGLATYQCSLSYTGYDVAPRIRNFLCGVTDKHSPREVLVIYDDVYCYGASKLEHISIPPSNKEVSGTSDALVCVTGPQAYIGPSDILVSAWVTTLEENGDHDPITFGGSINCDIKGANSVAVSTPGNSGSMTEISACETQYGPQLFYVPGAPLLLRKKNTSFSVGNDGGTQLMASADVGQWAGFWEACVEPHKDKTLDLTIAFTPSPSDYPPPITNGAQGAELKPGNS